MTMNDFWKKWRAELLRGAVIFVVVVAIGLTAVSFVGRLKAKGGNALAELARMGGDFGGSFDDPGRSHGDAWSWHAPLTPGQTLSIRNLNGPVEVAAATGPEAVVTAEKSWRNSDSGSVTIQAIPSSSGVVICAVWPGSTGSECTPGHEINFNFKGKHDRVSDVAVKFTVQVPKGVKVDVGSVAGDVDITGATAAVSAQTVTGDVSVETSAGPVSLSTVTGDVHATVASLGQGNSEVKAVTGDVSVSIPDHADLLVDAHTTAGDIDNDFSLPVSDQKYGPSHSMTGTLGKGGATLKLSTVTGDISLDKTTATTVRVVRVPGRAAVTTAPAVAPAAPPAPKPPHHPR